MGWRSRAWIRHAHATSSEQGRVHGPPRGLAASALDELKGRPATDRRRRPVRDQVSHQATVAAIARTSIGPGRPLDANQAPAARSATVSAASMPQNQTEERRWLPAVLGQCPVPRPLARRGPVDPDPVRGRTLREHDGLGVGAAAPAERVASCGRIGPRRPVTGRSALAIDSTAHEGGLAMRPC
jgi:hypothetical protein